METGHSIVATSANCSKEYMAIDSGGILCTNRLRAIIATWSHIHTISKNSVRQHIFKFCSLERANVDHEGLYSACLGNTADKTCFESGDILCTV